MKVNELRRWVNDIKTCLVLSLNNFYVPYCKYFGSQFLICVTGTLFTQIPNLTPRRGLRYCLKSCKMNWIDLPNSRLNIYF